MSRESGVVSHIEDVTDERGSEVVQVKLEPMNKDLLPPQTVDKGMVQGSSVVAHLDEVRGERGREVIMKLVPMNKDLLPRQTVDKGMVQGSSVVTHLDEVRGERGREVIMKLVPMNKDLLPRQTVDKGMVQGSSVVTHLDEVRGERGREVIMKLVPMNKDLLPRQTVDKGMVQGSSVVAHLEEVRGERGREVVKMKLEPMNKDLLPRQTVDKGMVQGSSVVAHLEEVRGERGSEVVKVKLEPMDKDWLPRQTVDKGMVQGSSVVAHLEEVRGERGSEVVQMKLVPLNKDLLPRQTVDKGMVQGSSVVAHLEEVRGERGSEVVKVKLEPMNKDLLPRQTLDKGMVQGSSAVAHLEEVRGERGSEVVKVKLEPMNEDLLPRQTVDKGMVQGSSVVAHLEEVRGERGSEVVKVKLEPMNKDLLPRQTVDKGMVQGSSVVAHLEEVRGERGSEVVKVKLEPMDKDWLPRQTVDKGMVQGSSVVAHLEEVRGERGSEVVQMKLVPMNKDLLPRQTVDKGMVQGSSVVAHLEEVRGERGSEVVKVKLEPMNKDLLPRQTVDKGMVQGSSVVAHLEEVRGERGSEVVKVKLEPMSKDLLPRQTVDKGMVQGSSVVAHLDEVRGERGSDVVQMKLEPMNKDLLPRQTVDKGMVKGSSVVAHLEEVRGERGSEVVKVKLEPMDEDWLPRQTVDKGMVQGSSVVAHLDEVRGERGSEVVQMKLEPMDKDLLPRQTVDKGMVQGSGVVAHLEKVREEEGSGAVSENLETGVEDTSLLQARTLSVKKLLESLLTAVEAHNTSLPVAATRSRSVVVQQATPPPAQEVIEKGKEMKCENKKLQIYSKWPKDKLFSVMKAIFQKPKALTEKAYEEVLEMKVVMVKTFLQQMFRNLFEHARKIAMERTDGCFFKLDDLKYIPLKNSGSERIEIFFGHCLNYDSTTMCWNDACLLRNVHLHRVFQVFNQHSLELPYYKEATDQGCWKVMSIRSNFRGQCMVIVNLELEKLSLAEEVFARLAPPLEELFVGGPGRASGVASVHLKFTAKEGSSSVWRCVCGKEYLKDKVLGLRLQLCKTLTLNSFDGIPLLCDTMREMLHLTKKTAVITVGLPDFLNILLAKVCSVVYCVKNKYDTSWSVFNENLTLNHIDNVLVIDEPSIPSMPSSEDKAKQFNEVCAIFTDTCDRSFSWQRLNKRSSEVRQLSQFLNIKRMLYLSLIPQETPHILKFACRKDNIFPFCIVKVVPVDVVPANHPVMLFSLVRASELKDLVDVQACKLVTEDIKWETKGKISGEKVKDITYWSVADPVLFSDPFEIVSQKPGTAKVQESGKVLPLKFDEIQEKETLANLALGDICRLLDKDITVVVKDPTDPFFFKVDSLRSIPVVNSMSEFFTSCFSTNSNTGTAKLAAQTPRNPHVQNVYKVVKEFVESSEWSLKRFWYSVSIRSNSAGKCMVIMRIHMYKHSAVGNVRDELKQRLHELFNSGPGKDTGVVSVHLGLQTASKNVTENAEWICAYGEEYLKDEVLGLHVRIGRDEMLNSFHGIILLCNIIEELLEMNKKTAVITVGNLDIVAMFVAKKCKMVYWVMDDFFAVPCHFDIQEAMKKVDNMVITLEPSADALPTTKCLSQHGEVCAILIENYFKLDAKKIDTRLQQVEKLREISLLKRMLFVCKFSHRAHLSLQILCKQDRSNTNPFVIVKVTCADIEPTTHQVTLIFFLVRVSELKDGIKPLTIPRIPPIKRNYFLPLVQGTPIPMQQAHPICNNSNTSVQTPAFRVPVLQNYALQKSLMQTPTFHVPVLENYMVHKHAVQSPAVQKPAEQTPVVQKPAEQTPAVQKPAEQTPVVQKPAEQTPVVQKPAEQTPAMQAPVLQEHEFQYQIPVLQNLRVQKHAIVTFSSSKPANISVPMSKPTNVTLSSSEPTNVTLPSSNLTNIALSSSLKPARVTLSSSKPANVTSPSSKPTNVILPSSKLREAGWNNMKKINSIPSQHSGQTEVLPVQLETKYKLAKLSLQEMCRELAKDITVIMKDCTPGYLFKLEKFKYTTAYSWSELYEVQSGIDFLTGKSELRYASTQSPKNRLVKKVFEDVRNFTKSLGLPYYSPSSKTGFWKSVLVRSNFAGKCMVVVHINVDNIYSAYQVFEEMKPEFCKLFMRRHGELGHVVSAHMKVSNVAGDTQWFLLYGEEHLEEEILDLRVLVSKTLTLSSFVGVPLLCNTMAEILELKKETAVIVVGTPDFITMFIAKRCSIVYYVSTSDMSDELRSLFYTNLTVNKLDNVVFMDGPSPKPITFSGKSRQFSEVCTVMIDTCNGPEDGQHEKCLLEVKRLCQLPCIKRWLYICTSVKVAKHTVKIFCMEDKDNTDPFVVVKVVCIDVPLRTEVNFVFFLMRASELKGLTENNNLVKFVPTKVRSQATSFQESVAKQTVSSMKRSSYESLQEHSAKKFKRSSPEILPPTHQTIVTNYKQPVPAESRSSNTKALDGSAKGSGMINMLSDDMIDEVGQQLEKQVKEAWNEIMLKDKGQIVEASDGQNFEDIVAKVVEIKPAEMLSNKVWPTARMEDAVEKSSGKQYKDEETWISDKPQEGNKRPKDLRMFDKSLEGNIRWEETRLSDNPVLRNVRLEEAKMSDKFVERKMRPEETRLCDYPQHKNIRPEGTRMYDNLKQLQSCSPSTKYDMSNYAINQPLGNFSTPLIYGNTEAGKFDNLCQHSSNEGRQSAAAGNFNSKSTMYRRSTYNAEGNLSTVQDIRDQSNTRLASDTVKHHASGGSILDTCGSSEWSRNSELNVRTDNSFGTSSRYINSVKHSRVNVDDDYDYYYGGVGGDDDDDGSGDKNTMFYSGNVSKTDSFSPDQNILRLDERNSGNVHSSISGFSFSSDMDDANLSSTTRTRFENSNQTRWNEQRTSPEFTSSGSVAAVSRLRQNERYARVRFSPEMERFNEEHTSKSKGHFDGIPAVQDRQTSYAPNSVPSFDSAKLSNILFSADSHSSWDKQDTRNRSGPEMEIFSREPIPRQNWRYDDSPIRWGERRSYDDDPDFDSFGFATSSHSTNNRESRHVQQNSFNRHYK